MIHLIYFNFNTFEIDVLKETLTNLKFPFILNLQNVNNIKLLINDKFFKKYYFSSYNNSLFYILSDLPLIRNESFPFKMSNENKIINISEVSLLDHLNKKLQFSLFIMINSELESNRNSDIIRTNQLFSLLELFANKDNVFYFGQTHLFNNVVLTDNWIDVFPDNTVKLIYKSSDYQVLNTDEITDNIINVTLKLIEKNKI